MGWTKLPFYELGQKEEGQGCIKYKCGVQITCRYAGTVSRMVQVGENVLCVVYKLLAGTISRLVQDGGNIPHAGHVSSITLS